MDIKRVRESILLLTQTPVLRTATNFFYDADFKRTGEAKTTILPSPLWARLLGIDVVKYSIIVTDADGSSRGQTFSTMRHNRTRRIDAVLDRLSAERADRAIPLASSFACGRRYIL